MLAICHEVGNLLAASRLMAHLLTRETGDAKDAASSRTIEDLAAKAGSLLAHIRILLADVPGPRVRIASRDLLSAVERAQPGLPGGASLRITQKRQATLSVEADLDAVHHTFCALVDASREAAGPGGAVEIGIESEARGDRASFVVIDDGPPFDEAAERSALRRGRHLVLELARAVAKRHGGVLRVRRRRHGTEVRLSLPCSRAEVPRRRAASARGARREARAEPEPAPGGAGRAMQPRAPDPPAGA